MPRDDILVEVENLHMYFPVATAGVIRRKVDYVKAVNGISLYIKRGETLGLVGESGCGKTTTARCILQLCKITRGRVFFEGKELNKVKGGELRKMRRYMQMVFQDPVTLLDPEMPVGDTIGEGLVIQQAGRG